MSIHELQARLRALDEAQIAYDEDEVDHKTVLAARQAVIEEARRVAEEAGEPVAWLFWHRSDPDMALASVTRVKDNAEHLAAHGCIVQPLHTTPPSADALVEALGKLSAEWRKYARSIAWGDEFEAGSNQRYDLCADALDAILAAHKENTDGR